MRAVSQGVGNIMPGDVVKGQVASVDDKGLVLSLTKNTTAYVPNEHLSDLGVKQGKAKYKVSYYHHTIPTTTLYSQELPSSDRAQSSSGAQ